ncbi:MAG TPA: TIGR04282 family arsenosugar biosynthesis glycosyltransferase [Salegentibacter sp.]|uniref:TIGR04282 family arsenosugar biosynthesis glycosyltransferase n=1 Tax=Salegentibacter sp. TaxID=1903072 RepID=UPI002F956D45
MKKNSEELLIIFAKNPEKGKVKTRLAKEIGDNAALDIYKFLLKHTYEVTKNLRVDKMIYYAENFPQQDIFESKTFRKKLQKGNDLGEKMEHAFYEAFSASYKRVILIGTDLPDISQRDIENAFVQLKVKDVVIGPAKDGGYYLLGMKSINSKVFKDKAWSTSSVLENTLEDFKDNNVKLLQTLSDIDVLSDIPGESELRKFIKDD